MRKAKVVARLMTLAQVVLDLLQQAEAEDRLRIVPGGFLVGLEGELLAALQA